MKYLEIIKETKELYPNEYSESEIKKWIIEAEQTAADYIGATAAAPHDLNDEVFIESPYDRMFIYYVLAQVALHQHDDESYARYINAYNSRYREWQKHYIRTNSGKTIRFKNWI